MNYLKSVSDPFDAIVTEWEQNPADRLSKVCENLD